MTQTDVSRGEFNMLSAAVQANATRLDALDQGGTRGVGIVQVQLHDLAKDVSSLSTRLDQHERDHQTEIRDRKSAKRWTISVAIAAMAAIEGPLVYLISQGH